MEYINQQIAVLGCGASGTAAAELLSREGAIVTVLDTATRKQLGPRVAHLEQLGVTVRTGHDSLENNTDFQRAVISPGIPRSAPLVKRLLARRIDMIGEIELAYKMCHCPVIAVTGTNGKTTVTGLIYAMLAGCGKAVAAGGNLGPPFSSLVGRSRELDYVVVETSSFQLEEIRNFRPQVAVWVVVELPLEQENR